MRPIRAYPIVCVKDHLIVDAFGTPVRLRRGREYSVSQQRKGRVTVFTAPMLTAPARLFRPPVFGAKDELMPRPHKL